MQLKKIGTVQYNNT